MLDKYKSLIDSIHINSSVSTKKQSAMEAKKNRKKQGGKPITSRSTTLFNYLKKIITWQSMSFIAAIIMPIIIYQCQKDDNKLFKSDKNTILKDSIKSSIIIIESTFKPADIILSLDYNNYILEHVRDFQQNSLDLVSCWNVITSAPSLMTFKNENTKTIEIIMNERSTNLDYFKKKLIELVSLINDIDTWGEFNQIQNYKLNKELTFQLAIKGENFEKHINDNQMKIDNISNRLKQYKGSDSIVKNIPDYLELMRHYDNNTNCLEFQELCNHLFKLIIIQNKKYMSAYSDYVNKSDKAHLSEEREKERIEIQSIKDYD